MKSVVYSLNIFPNSVPHSRHRLARADPSPQIHLLQFAIHKNCKAAGSKVENEISNIVHVQCSLHLQKAGTMMDNMNESINQSINQSINFISTG